jgi:hypothetical protein
LVRPWFWKSVKNKYFFNDDVRIGFGKKSWKGELVVEILCFVGVFIFSMCIYAWAGFRQNLYGSFPLIMVCFLLQCLWDNQGKVCDIVMLTIVAVSAIFWIWDGIVGFDISVPLNAVDSVPLTATQVDENTEVKLFVSSSEIQSLFKVDSASGPTYNNGKYIFTVSGGDNGKGLVVIDKDNYTEAKFLSCSYGLKVADVRSQYPIQKLKKLYITISDDNVPYGLFAVADKNWILGSYNVNGYVMLNLITGEAQEFKPEELPKFVTNN